MDISLGSNAQGMKELFCNVPPPRGWARLHLSAYLGHRLPSQTNTSFFAHFVLTRAHLGRTSRSVTHPQIGLGQARLTSQFFGDRLPEKKVVNCWYKYPIKP